MDLLFKEEVSLKSEIKTMMLCAVVTLTDSKT